MRKTIELDFGIKIINGDDVEWLFDTCRGVGAVESFKGDQITVEIDGDDIWEIAETVNYLKHEIHSFLGMRVESTPALARKKDRVNLGKVVRSQLHGRTWLYIDHEGDIQDGGPLGIEKNVAEEDNSERDWFWERKDSNTWALYAWES